MPHVYIETHEEKSLRQGKIKAYGACDKHKNHWSWGEYIFGIITAIPFLGIAAFTGACINDKGPVLPVREYVPSVIQIECTGKRTYANAVLPWDSSVEMDVDKGKCTFHNTPMSSFESLSVN